jgi:hypothetical protein
VADKKWTKYIESKQVNVLETTNNYLWLTPNLGVPLTNDST